MPAPAEAEAAVRLPRNAMNCTRCQDIRWICEEHPDKPMEHDGCKGAGMPCPDCNPSSRGKVPVLPPDFEVDRRNDEPTD